MIEKGTLTPKIVDFGVSELFTPDGGDLTENKCCGTRAYHSPEIYDRIFIV